MDVPIIKLFKRGKIYHRPRFNEKLQYKEVAELARDGKLFTVYENDIDVTLNILRKIACERNI